MRIYDIINEDEPVAEAPAGMLKQVGRKLGAKAAGAVGMKGTAAGLGGAAKTGNEANQLKVALKGYAGETGKNLKQLDAADLGAFLKSKGYPTTAAQGVSGILTPKQIDDIVLKTVQAKKTAKGGTAPKATGAGAADAVAGAAGSGGSDSGGGAPGKAQNFMNKLQQKVGGGNNAEPGTNVAGTPTTPQVDKNKDGKDDNTGKVIPMPTKAKAGSTLPKEIQTQLDQLSPTEKAALAGALA